VIEVSEGLAGAGHPDADEPAQPVADKHRLRSLQVVEAEAGFHSPAFPQQAAAQHAVQQPRRWRRRQQHAAPLDEDIRAGAFRKLSLSFRNTASKCPAAITRASSES
jgi:hypothetical protein